MQMIPPSGGDSFTGPSGTSYTGTTGKQLSIGGGDVAMANQRGWTQASAQSINVNSINTGTGTNDIPLAGNSISAYWSLEQATAQSYGLAGPTDTTVNSSDASQFVKMVNVGAGTATIQAANAPGTYLNDNSALTNNHLVLTTGQWAEFILAVNQTTNRTYWAVMTNGTIS